MLICVEDGPQRDVLQRTPIKTVTTAGSAFRGARGARIAEAMAQDRTSRQGTQSRARHRREDQDRRRSERRDCKEGTRRRRLASTAIQESPGRSGRTGRRRGRSRVDHQRAHVSSPNRSTPAYAERSLIVFHSDGRSPEQLTEQVLSIYPILNGQVASGENNVPSRPAEDRHVESKPATVPAATIPTQNDLIDFGADGSTEAPQPQRPAAVSNPAVESTGEISGLLKSTGKPAGAGPLLDFTNDMKETVPVITRGDTTGSCQDSVDAKE